MIKDKVAKKLDLSERNYLGKKPELFIKAKNENCCTKQSEHTKIGFS